MIPDHVTHAVSKALFMLPPAMTSPQAKDGADFGFQWWLPPDASPGEVMAQGIYGQYI